MNRGQLLERSMRAMGAAEVSGVATSGSTLTIVDTAIVNRYAANKFNQAWVAFISSSSDGAAPQSEYKIAASFARVSGTITLKSAFSAAIGAGDQYAMMKAPVAIYELEKLATEALDEFGFSFYRLDTSLTTADQTLHYTLPVALKGRRPHSIYLRDSKNYEFEAPPFEILPAAGGSTATLRFVTQPSSSKTIVIRYLAEHDGLTVYSDIVDESIPDALAIASLVEKGFRAIALPRRRARDVDNWNDAKQNVDKLMVTLGISKEPRREKFISASRYN